MLSVFASGRRDSRRSRVAGLVTVCLSICLASGVAAADGSEIFARLQTDAGDILLVLAPELAPHHVDNFLHLARSGFYEGTYFHRIIPKFMIQGGDPNTKDDLRFNDGQGGPGWGDVLTPDELAQLLAVTEMLETKGYAFGGGGDRANLKAEFSPTAKHERGTLSMARANDPDSAGSQFFICVAKKTYLDGQYTAFGSVVTGMDVVDQIVNGRQQTGQGNQPVDPVHIQEVTVIEGAENLTAAELEAFTAAAGAAQE